MPIGCRSDEGLSAPVIRRLKAADWCDVITLDLVPQQFGHSYNLTEAMLYETRPDLVLITGDRVEMCAAAAAAFHNKVKIAHLYAGIVNDPVTTFDDVDRHCITLWSDIQFCESETAHRQTCYLMASAGLHKKLNSYVVGISHLDDIEIDGSKVPKSCHNGIDPIDYDLLLINNEPLGETPTVSKERYTIQIGGNPDGKFPVVGDERYENLHRPQFLGLLKNCQRFITNSSAAIYEAPYFLKPEQIVMVGQRNCNRPAVECKPGGSDRVVEVLRDYANAYMDRSKD